MQIGSLFINIKEINYFEVFEITSVDIRIYIYFKNGSSVWTRTNGEEIEKLKQKFNSIIIS